VSAERRILAIARTVTSTLRLLEAVSCLDGDTRVEVIFTINDSSPFSGGVRGLLEDAGARVIGWGQARRERFDLAVTASENTELAGLDAPVLILPHGIGFHKLLPDTRPGDTRQPASRRLSGAPRRADVDGGRVTVAVSHPDQAAQLIEHSPYLAGLTALVEDPVHSRLLASLPFRDRYRSALDLGDRRLVVFGSTWGPESLFGRWPDLPARLLAELPADEYRVAAVLHPNVWSGHQAWQLRSWLARARAAGLLVMPPEGSWPALLAAADCLIGDHGSVSLYAAAAGLPVLLAPFGVETVPGTAIARLGELVNRLDPEASLLGQVRAARRPPGAGTPFAADARPLRAVMYDLMKLPAPPFEQPRPGYPVPGPEHAPPGAYAVYVRQIPGGVELRRIPAAVDSLATAPGGWWRHLAVEEHEWDQRLLESAAVLVAPSPSLPDRITVVPSPTGATVTLPAGAMIDVDGPGGPMLLAAVVWMLSHLDSPLEGPVTMRVGAVDSRVSLRPRGRSTGPAAP
jgi:hypothetical protein